MAGVGGAIAADLNGVHSGRLVALDGFPTSPNDERVLLFLEDQRRDGGIFDRRRLREPERDVGCAES